MLIVVVMTIAVGMVQSVRWRLQADMLLFGRSRHGIAGREQIAVVAVVDLVSVLLLLRGEVFGIKIVDAVACAATHGNRPVSVCRKKKKNINNNVK